MDLPARKPPVEIVQTYVDHLDSDAVKKIRYEIILEYGVTTMSEKLLVDLAVSAYMRFLETTRIHSSLLDVKMKTAEGEGWTYEYYPNKVNLIKELGKQINWAYQQYVTTLTMLKESKRPPINVKIQAKQAFVAENQQFNNDA